MAKKKATPKKPVPQTLEPFDWLTIKQTANYLQCSTRTVHRYISEGKLRVSQVIAKGKIRVPTASIRAMLSN